MDVVPPGETHGNPALRPKCSIQTFERIVSGYSELTQTLADVFGQMGSQAAEEAQAVEALMDAEDGYEAALDAHKSACRHGVDTCDCQKAEERLDRATERP